jgi:hypothetical protein
MLHSCNRTKVKFMQIIGIKPIMSSLCDKKVDKYFTRMSQISAKYATQLFVKL